MKIAITINNGEGSIILYGDKLEVCKTKNSKTLYLWNDTSITASVPMSMFQNLKYEMTFSDNTKCYSIGGQE